MFLRVSKHVRQFSIKFASLITNILMCGFLSISILPPVLPIPMYKRLTAFLVAACKDKLPNIAATRGSSSVGVLFISVIEMEFLASIANSKNSIHCSQSVDGGFSSSCQKYGTPGNGADEGSSVSEA